MTNYFELFGLPLSFKVDAEALRTKFYELSKVNHPDRFMATGAERQEEALEYTSQLNTAYKVLSNESERLQYVLELNGLMEDEKSYKLPNNFLMTMMELNEMVDELSPGSAAPELANAQKLIEEQLQEISQPVQQTLNAAILDEKNMAHLALVKEYYLKRKYLLRIQEKLTTFAGH